MLEFHQGKECHHWACSYFASVSRPALVNEPASWPNSSLSIMLSVRALTVRTTNGFAPDIREIECKARTITSLPVPSHSVNDDGASNASMRERKHLLTYGVHRFWILMLWIQSVDYNHAIRRLANFAGLLRADTALPRQVELFYQLTGIERFSQKVERTQLHHASIAIEYPACRSHQ